MLAREQASVWNCRRVGRGGGRASELWAGAGWVAAGTGLGGRGGPAAGGAASTVAKRRARQTATGVACAETAHASAKRRSRGNAPLPHAPVFAACRSALLPSNPTLHAFVGGACAGQIASTSSAHELPMAASALAAVCAATVSVLARPASVAPTARSSVARTRRARDTASAYASLGRTRSKRVARAISTGRATRASIRTGVRKAPTRVAKTRRAACASVARAGANRVGSARHAS